MSTYYDIDAILTDAQVRTLSFASSPDPSYVKAYASMYWYWR